MEHLIGKKIMEFELPAYAGDELVTITNKDLEGKWSVFFFYPGDFTFVCPTELEDLADNYKAFQEANTEIYAVSTDSEFTHKAWKDASEAVGKVEYPMLSDRAFKLSQFFGILLEDEGQALRGTFIVNPEGEIVAYEIHSPGIGRNAEELLRKVRAAQFVHEHSDQVCPAKWQPGSETLTPGLDLVGKI